MQQMHPTKVPRIFMFPFRVTILIAAVIIAPAAIAEALVSGPIDAVQVDANEVPVSELLRKLGATFEVHYRGTLDASRPLTGTYRGPLREVIARLLVGYDYILKNSNSSIEIIIYGKSGQTPDGSNAPIVAQNNSSTTTSSSPASAAVAATANGAPVALPKAQPAPTVAAQRPSPSSDSLSTMLGIAARVATSPIGPPTLSASPAAQPNEVDMAAMTHRATAALEGLRSALNAVTPH